MSSPTGAQFGQSVAGLGDINGDGHVDVIIGAGGGEGYFRIISGKSITDTHGLQVLYSGTGSGSDELGMFVANAGDINNDGVNDFIVGAPGNSVNDPGYANLYSGATGQLIVTLNGRNHAGDQFGISAAGVGDANNDEFNDVVVGSQAGYATLYSGKNWSVLAELTVSDSAATRPIAVGDVNGDGLPDVIVGGPDAGGTEIGAVQLYVTQVASTVDATPTFVEGGAAVVLDPSIAIYDQELGALNNGDGNYSGASVTIARHTAANGEDHFGFSLSGSPLFSVSGNSLIAGGQTVATVTQNGDGTLIISFTDAGGTIPTQGIVNDILSRITYSNSSEKPPASVQLDFTFNDGNSGAQGGGGAGSVTESVTVGITSVNDTPVVGTAGAALTYIEQHAAAAIAPLSTVTDLDSADFNGGSLTVAFTANGAASDRLHDRKPGHRRGPDQRRRRLCILRRRGHRQLHRRQQRRSPRRQL